jgi:hypothetical protein
MVKLKRKINLIKEPIKQSKEQKSKWKKQNIMN